MSSKVRTAVVGVGYLGRFHAQKHKLLNSVELIGVCDVNQKRAQEVATELDVVAFTNPKELIGKVDAVAIVTDTPHHFDIAKMFLQEGVSLLVEKPITTTSKEAAQLIELASRKNLTLQVGHIERFNPAFAACLPKLEDVVAIEMFRYAPFKTRGSDVDVILDLMIHDLDLLLSMEGSSVVDVKARGASIVTQTNDVVQAHFEFESGVIASVSVSRVNSISKRAFSVTQKNSIMNVDLGEGIIELVTRSKSNEMPVEIVTNKVEKADALFIETKAFIDAILGATPAIVPGEDGLEALLLAEQVQEKLKKRA